MLMAKNDLLEMFQKQSHNAVHKGPFQILNHFHTPTTSALKPFVSNLVVMFVSNENTST